MWRPVGHYPDGIRQIDVPDSLKKSSHPLLPHEFSIIHQRVEIEGKEEDRPLHAKSVWLERDGRALYMLGSSNFTAAGLGLRKGHNIELNVAYLIRDCASRFGKLCAQSGPLEEALDDLVDVQFLADGPLRILRGTAQKVPCVEELAAPYFRFKDAGAEMCSPRRDPADE